jgi:2-dehydropantoate 2-reductase
MSMGDSTVDVIGVGGAGGFLASSLYLGGIRPRIISRGAALRQLREVGLTILTDGKRRIYAPINNMALEDVQQFAPIILLTAKSYDIPALLEEIAPRVTADTLLVSIQNGFAAYDALCNAFGPDRSAMGVLYVSASIVSPAVIEIMSGVGQLLLPTRHRGVLQPLVDSLCIADVEADLVDDIERRMWMKQLFLVPFSIVNAELRQPIGMLREDAAARARWGAIAQEIAAIASACGMSMPIDAAEVSLAVAERFDPQADSSFARDVWAHRPQEGEALFGPLVHRAREHDVGCPLLQEAYERYVG